MAKQEQIIFNSVNREKNKLSSVELLINPETLTLTWKKVINRVRTKTRLVTLFWGEEPVRFTYTGQTGYTKPTLLRTDITGVGGVEAYNKEQMGRMTAISNYISKLQTQIKIGGPYTEGSQEENIQKINDYANELKTIRLIQPGNLSELAAGKDMTGTDLLLLSDKFNGLKQLENLYRAFQDPANLVDVLYRKYKFEGYFESFSFTDDARNPWNWRYSIDFTILRWEDNAKEISAQSEYLFLETKENVYAQKE